LKNLILPLKYAIGFPSLFLIDPVFLCGWESFSIRSLGQFIGAESSWFSVLVAREFIPGPLEKTRANAFIFLLLFSHSQCCRRRSGTGLSTRLGQDFHSYFELAGWALRSIFGFGAGFKFLIPVPCSNTRLANILFLGLRGLVLLAEHITGDSVFLWFRACPVSKKCNFSVCLFSLLSSNPSLLLALLASAVTRVSCRQIIVCWFLLCDSSVDLTPSDFFSPLVFSCSR
jgi:hypothetical protein